MVFLWVLWDSMDFYFCDISMGFLWMSMVFLWGFYGVSKRCPMGFPLDSYGVSVVFLSGFLWEFYGMSMRYISFGISMICSKRWLCDLNNKKTMWILWGVYDISLGLLLNFYGGVWWYVYGDSFLWGFKKDVLWYFHWNFYGITIISSRGLTIGISEGMRWNSMGCLMAFPLFSYGFFKRCVYGISIGITMWFPWWHSYDISRRFPWDVWRDCYGNVYGVLMGILSGFYAMWK